jgi:hypothetical protein
LVLDRNKIAALLESLCERPFAGDPEAVHSQDSMRPQDIAHRAAQALSKGQEAGSNAEVRVELSAGSDEGTIPPAALAAILSGTATAAQCDAFQDAAATSHAVRLEAQSALAFIDGIEQAPQVAPAHLVQEALASTATAPALAAAKGGSSFWSRFVPRRQAAAALAVLLLGGGLSWSLLWRGSGYEGQTSPVVPAAIGPDDSQFLRAGAPASNAPIAAAPSDRVPVVASPPAPATRSLIAPQQAPAMLPNSAAPEPEEALVDPCAPRGFGRAVAAQAEAQAPSDAVKRAPPPPPKSAAAAVPEPGCEAGRRLLQSPSLEQAKEAADPLADKGPIYRPASRSDPAAAVAPAAVPRAGAARPAVPGTQAR